MIFIFDDKNEPADIFADIPSEKAPPATGYSSGTTPLPVGASGVILEGATFGKKWVVVVVLMALIGGGVGFFILARKPAVTVPADTPTVTETAPIAPQPEPQPIPQPEPEPEPQPVSEPETVQPSNNMDTDGDGLTDTQEGALGTNPNKVDTDEDGLNDREEVQVYLTDPLNPDTDGDSYSDGDEVKNLYNPKGPGRLGDIPVVQ